MMQMKKILMMVMSFCLFHSTIACNEKQEFYDDFIDENQERVGDNRSEERRVGKECRR